MKYNTVITDMNGGNHSPRQTKAAWEWLEGCVQDYASPQLYHIGIANAVEAEGYAGYAMHKAFLKAIMKQLGRKGIRATFKAAKEDDTARNPEGKGEHLHAFICCESRYVNPYKVLNEEHDKWLRRYAKARMLRVWINEPRNLMHGGANYISLPKFNPDKLEDAKVWVTYLHKLRDKPASGEIYTSSRGIPSTKAKSVNAQSLH